MCRTNFQNATNVYDTIGIVRFVTLPYPHNITPTIRRFKAITVDGTEIPFNTCAGSVYMRLAASVEEHSGNPGNIKIYPNPTRGEFTAEGLNLNISRIEILNVLGEKVFEKDYLIAHSSAEIAVSLDVPSGVYFVKATTDRGITVRKLVVE
jgi:hypothetical protein